MKPVSEDEMLRRLVKYVRTHCGQSRLGSPDYKATHFYTEQWQRSGAVFWYRLPKSKGSKIIAGGYDVPYAEGRQRVCYFSETGEIDLVRIHVEYDTREKE